MKQYSYDGPVMVFDICVASRWVGITYAPTEAKARSNLTYQAKKDAWQAPEHTSHTSRQDTTGRVKLYS